MVKRVSQDEFINRVREWFGDTLDFSQTSYNGAHNNVTVVCPIHGEFTTKAHRLGNGIGCWACGVIKRTSAAKLGKAEFIRRASLVFDDGMFDYSDTIVDRLKDPVNIVCNKHNLIFSQRPSTHMKGQTGCPLCIQEIKAENGRRSLDSAEVFKVKSELMHGEGRYDYTLVEYRGNKQKVLLRCNDCGLIFSQRPNDHTQGVGCPACVGSGFDKSKPAVVYVCRVTTPHSRFTGYGITGDITTRLATHRRNLFYAEADYSDLFISSEVLGEVAEDTERGIMKRFSKSAEKVTISGFITENTSAPFEEVVAFVQKYLENREGS